MEIYIKHANKLLELVQSMYVEQKGKLNLTIRGENAALLLIYNDDQVSPKDISEILQVSTARVATILNNLEKKKLITRKINPKDRRQIIITLNNNGKTVAKNIINKHLVISSLIFEKLGLDDTLKALELLEKVKNILNEIECPFEKEDNNVTT